MRRDAERIGRIQTALREAKTDALVCTLPVNVLLLSGYWPVIGTSIAIATSEGRVAVLAPRDESDLAHNSGADEVHTFGTGSLEKITTATEAVREPLQRLLRKLGLERAVVACEGAEAFEPSSYAAMHLYFAAIVDLLSAALRGGSLISADRLLTKLHSVNTPLEIESVRRVCRIAQSAYLEGAQRLHTGILETEAAVHFRSPLSIQGTGYEGVERADGFVFCMSGVNSASAYGAYARSRAKEIAQNDLVLTHCNSYADGYWTDITRTFVMGEPDRRKRDMYEAVFAARAAALNEIRPGAEARSIDAAARDVMRARGFEKAFKHPTGHGVGLAAISHNALPRLHPASSDRLEAGMVFNVEPAVYLEDYGGLRHCDMVAVAENGAELLTPFQCRLEELIK